jgi:hypothetical protein
MISTSGFPEITNFEIFVERCNMHYYNYQDACKHKQVEAMTEKDFKDNFTTIQGEEFEKMFLALQLRRFVEINEGNVIRLIPDFINPTTNLDEESKAFATWLLKRFKTVNNIK